MLSYLKPSSPKEIYLPAVELAGMSHLAYAIADAVLPGQIILLNGDLGAGKTTLTKFIAAAFGIVETVSSPTFTLQKVYRLPKPQNGVDALLHYDLYRIKTWEDVLDLGLFDLADGAITVVEWAERFPQWAHDTPTIRLEHISEDTRSIRLANIPITLDGIV